MLDYHLHLWPHTERDVEPLVEQVAEYCDRAGRAGVVEIALTEHLFRFRQARDLLDGFWRKDEPSGELRASMEEYWDFHARVDLDAYVGCVLAARDAGLPVVLGLEVDYYPDRMDEVARLLEGYPFDVLLGSVHWTGAWRFDDLSDDRSMLEWSTRSVERCWDDYTRSLEELAASGTCDVLAHPDLIKVCGHRPGTPDEWWDRMAEAAKASGMAAEVSSAGWRKPVGEQYPAPPLLARLVERGVPLTTASDAHHSDHVADRSDEIRRLLVDAGVRELQGFRHRKPHAVSLEDPPGDTDGAGPVGAGRP